MVFNRSRRFALPDAFRFPAYRNYWLGMFCAVGGFQIVMFGQFWLVHELTGSALYLGYVGMANAIPAIALNLLGGVVADKVDQKRLIVVTEMISSTLVILLGLLTLTGIVKVWHVMMIAIFAGAVSAFNQPARQALYPHLVDQKALMSAVALNASVWTANRIIAPAIAGMVIAAFGTTSSFFLGGAGMITFALVVSRLEVPKIESRPSNSPGRDLADSLRFLKDNGIFLFLILMTFFNSFFGMAYVTQMPVFARDILKIGADGQGVLLGINGIGSLLMTMWVAFRGNLRDRGLALIGGAAFSGLSVACFALSCEYVGSYVLAGVFMFATGISSSLYLVCVLSALQMMVPGQMRGRVMGFYAMTWNIMPLGGMYAGALTGLIGTPWAIAAGGILVTAFALGPALFNDQVRNLELLLPTARGQAAGQDREKH